MKTDDLVQKDKIERELALHPQQSFIVKAPAGSGKTELLIQRFLTLLGQVKAPEEILAITFTKKAANEMRARLIKALKRAQDCAPQSGHALDTWKLAKKALERDKKFNWNLIKNPNQLRIQTIDSFCTYLTKQLPLLSHFGSEPAISDYPDALYREAVQELLTHVEQKVAWAPAISELLLHLDNDLNKLHDLLIGLLSKRDQWLSYLHFNNNENEIKARLEAHLACLISDNLKLIKEKFPKELVDECLTIARFASHHLSLINQEAPLYACRNLKTLPNTEAENHAQWLGLATLLLTKKFTWRKRPDEELGFKPLNECMGEEKTLQTEYRKRFTQLLLKLQEDETLRLLLSELFFLPKPYYEPEQWQVLKSLLYVLKIAAAQLRLIFEQHGEVDFIENAQAAILALGQEDEITDLTLALDYRISQILVDEFQDTSYTQYQLLERLTAGWSPGDGRSLFVVGDPMQSIYRFREAEVGLFIRMCQTGIGEISLTPLTLTHNFRSSPAIVDWNNHHFKTIFPPFSDMTRGAVHYSESFSEKIEENEESIYIHGFVNDEENHQDEAIVDFIKNTHLQYPNEKIAILVRSRSHLSELLPLLKKNKLSYQAIDIEPLALRPAIQDLFSLTQALLKPYDRIAWLAILRAPWCGLNLADLLIIAGQEGYKTIEEQLENQEVINKLSKDSRLRLSKTFSILKNKIRERSRCDLRSLIEDTWLLLGGPATLKDETDLDDVNAYFQLLGEFDERYPSLNLDLLKEKMAGLFAATDQNNPLLQIMTIHAAKGLEFDTVILPHLQKGMRSDERSLLTWIEMPLSNTEHALLLAPLHATGNKKDVLYEYILRQEKTKNEYEKDRLLYVATTRAKKRLALFFNLEQNEKEEYEVASNSLLEKLWPILSKNPSRIFLKHFSKQEEKNKLENKTRYISRLTSQWQNPLQSKENTSPILHQKQEGFKFKESYAKQMGVVMHSLLQQIAEFSCTWWQEKSSTEQHAFLLQQLKQVGMSKNITENASKLKDMLEKTLKDPKGQWILQQHKKSQSEFALTAVIENEVTKIIIDRTFIDAEGTRWIIDYKTATLSHRDLQDFLDNEMKKYSKKMYEYYKVMQLYEERPIRLGLYFPALSAWKEIQLDETTSTFIN